MIRFAYFVPLTLLALGVAFGQSKLPTMEEAQQLSAKTGRPIFAMAGQQT